MCQPWRSLQLSYYLKRWSDFKNSSMLRWKMHSNSYYGRKRERRRNWGRRSWRFWRSGYWRRVRSQSIKLIINCWEKSASCWITGTIIASRIRRVWPWSSWTCPTRREKTRRITTLARDWRPRRLKLIYH